MVRARRCSSSATTLKMPSTPPTTRPWSLPSRPPFLSRRPRARARFTVFAPTNAAFEMCQMAPSTHCLMEENRDQLTGVLTYHVVAGNLSGPELGRMAQMGGDDAMLTTVQGGMLTVVPSGDGHRRSVDSNGQ